MDYCNQLINNLIINNFNEHNIKYSRNEFFSDFENNYNNIQQYLANNNPDKDKIILFIKNILNEKFWNRYFFQNNIIDNFINLLFGIIDNNNYYLSKITFILLSKIFILNIKIDYNDNILNNMNTQEFNLINYKLYIIFFNEICENIKKLTEEDKSKLVNIFYSILNKLINLENKEIDMIVILINIIKNILFFLYKQLIVNHEEIINLFRLYLNLMKKNDYLFKIIVEAITELIEFYYKIFPELLKEFNENITNYFISNEDTFDEEKENINLSILEFFNKILDFESIINLKEGFYTNNYNNLSIIKSLNNKVFNFFECKNFDISNSTFQNYIFSFIRMIVIYDNKNEKMNEYFEEILQYNEDKKNIFFTLSTVLMFSNINKDYINNYIIISFSKINKYILEINNFNLHYIYLLYLNELAINKVIWFKNKNNLHIIIQLINYYINNDLIFFIKIIEIISTILKNINIFVIININIIKDLINNLFEVINRICINYNTFNNFKIENILYLINILINCNNNRNFIYFDFFKNTFEILNNLINLEMYKKLDKIYKDEIINNIALIFISLYDKNLKNYKFISSIKNNDDFNILNNNILNYLVIKIKIEYNIYYMKLYLKIAEKLNKNNEEILNISFNYMDNAMANCVVNDNYIMEFELYSSIYVYLIENYEEEKENYLNKFIMIIFENYYWNENYNNMINYKICFIDNIIDLLYKYYDLLYQDSFDIIIMNIKKFILNYKEHYISNNNSIGEYNTLYDLFLEIIILFSKFFSNTQEFNKFMSFFFKYLNEYFFVLIRKDINYNKLIFSLFNDYRYKEVLTNNENLSDNFIKYFKNLNYLNPDIFIYEEIE